MTASPTKDVLSFGPFRLVASERLLTREGAPVELGSRALDVLIALASRCNEVISKADLLARVWRDIHVDEGSLRFHIASLRKALGDGERGARYIVTVPGQGYSFVAAVSRSSGQVAAVATFTAVAAGFTHANLPARPTGLIDREEDLEKLAARLGRARFVSIVGAGGVGKTTLALALGHQLIDAFAGAVLFVDFGMLSDPRLVASTVASMLGLSVQSDDATPSLIAYLRDMRILLILDTCEHLIEAVAALASRIFVAAPQVHMLATSREALSVEGELVYRLEPLACPPADMAITASIARTFPATQLFVERAVASGAHFELNDAEAAIVVGICRKLDGVALAIELAARRVEAFGLQQTAALLEQRLTLLWLGPRTAPPRQKTLQATLDWSYGLLSEIERVVLRRLAVFVGHFTLDAALAVATSANVDQARVFGAIDSLLAKSMVATAPVGAMMRYRLLDTTRAYALDIGIEDAEAADLARRHAQFYCGYLDRPASANSPLADPNPSLRDSLGNIRAALQWCFAPGGDRAVGIDLVAASAHYFVEMSLLTECQYWVEQATAGIAMAPTSPGRELALRYAAGISLMFTSNSDEAQVSLNKGLEIAAALNDLHSELRILSALHIFKTRVPDFTGALEMGERCIAVARKLGDPSSVTMAEWIAGTTNHLLGDQVEACARCGSAVTRTISPEWGSVGRLGYDRRIIALDAHARALWLLGRPEQAAEVANHAIKEADKLANPWTLVFALVYSTTVFIWRADRERAEENIERLIAYSTKYLLKPYHAAALGLKGELAIKTGSPAIGVGLLRESLESASRIQLLAPVFMGALAEGLVTIGQSDEALTTIEAAIAQPASFAYAELLRIKGEVQRSLNQPAAVVEASLLQSLQHARNQSALGWQLRAAMSLAKIWADGNRRADALALLRPLYEKFTDGFDTADLKEARQLLEKLTKPTRRSTPNRQERL
jgi:predicted ATPase/DNA-binding winged helix-turn-helix (wHTH) protein